MTTPPTPASVYIDDQWFAAHWRLGAIEKDNGTVYLTGTIDPTGTPIVVRLDMATVQRIRTEAGFTGPVPAADTYDCRTLSNRVAQLERSHRLLDDRTADSAVDLRQQIAQTTERLMQLDRDTASLESLVQNFIMEMAAGHVYFPNGLRGA